MIKKTKINIPYIDSRRPVSIKSMGNIKQINISDRQNTGATIKPISKNEYIIVSTGEVKPIMHHARDRTENLRNLEKTMRCLRDLINTNVTPYNVERVRFITLTYKDNMRDCKALYLDFSNFNKRLKRYISKQYNELTYEYIVCVEAQGRGAFHLHMITIFSKAPPFIENQILAEIWGHGFTSIKKLSGDIDNIGAYLTAYLSDLDIESGVTLTPDLLKGELREVQSEAGESKHIIKGARLKLLPVGINIYRYSRGIKKPIVTHMSYDEAILELSAEGYTKVYETATKITDTERDFSSTFISQTYKKHINEKFWCDGSNLSQKTPIKNKTEK